MSNLSDLDHDPRFDASRVIRAPRGAQRACKSWLTEAAYRMIQNNLDPDVAENPQHLVVYGGIGRAARNWACFDRILEVLKELGDDESLLIQSGKPVGVFKTHADAPRVLLANSNLVPRWATWEHFNELDRKGLFMYGQMTAGSWIYIGSQGIVQGTYETFAEAGRQHFGGSWAGRWILTRGTGRHGRRAAARGDACGCGVAQRRVPAVEPRLPAAHPLSRQDRRRISTMRWRWFAQHCERREAVSIGVLGNAADVLPELVRTARRPAASSPTSSPTRRPRTISSTAICRSAGRWSDGRPRSATMRCTRRSPTPPRSPVPCTCSAMLDFHAMGIPVVDYGNNIRQVAFDQGVANAFDFPGFVPAYIRPLFCEGRGPFRWVALSGDPEDIYKTDAKIKELFPQNAHVHRWLDMARERIAFQGLPGAHLLAGTRRAASRRSRVQRNGAQSGELKAPIVIGRDHLDTGSVASPNRETESMRDGTDAVSDWPLLNALLNTAGGATWVSFHHGGGVGMGYSQHAGVVIVADGTDAAAKRLARVLFNDPASGVMRHADAGYEAAIRTRARAEPAPADDRLTKGTRWPAATRTIGTRCGSTSISRRSRGCRGATARFATARSPPRTDASRGSAGAATFRPASTARVTEDGRGCWLLPGLIDCHTHIVYAGNRSDEFEARLNGATYEDIARRAAGIARDGEGDARGDGSRSAGGERAARREPSRRRRDDDRDQVGLRARSRSRAKMLRAARTIGRRCCRCA